jgi:hypothetical protein
MHACMYVCMYVEERRREEERAVVALREQEENDMQMEGKYNTIQVSLNQRLDRGLVRV